MATKIEKFFGHLEPLLQEIKSIGNDLDRDVALLKPIYNKLINIQGLGLLIPSTLGGLGGERTDWMHYNILLAEHSGALLFLQAQHQYAIAKLKQLLPNKPIEELFRAIIHNNMGIGIFIAVRRKCIEAQRTAEGFKLNGQLPWITGLNFFQKILLAFVVDDIIYYTLIPFHTIHRQNTSIVVSPPLQTAAFQATNTATISLNNWLVTARDILVTTPNISSAQLLHPTVYNFAGAAKAALAIAEKGKYFSTEAQLTFAKLNQQWQNYYSDLVRNDSDPFQLRAAGLILAEQCVLFARICCGAVSLLESHPLTRISREIWQYTIAGYTEEQASAYLHFTALCHAPPYNMQYLSRRMNQENI